MTLPHTKNDISSRKLDDNRTKKREKREKEKHIESPSRNNSQVGLDQCEGNITRKDYQVRNNNGKST